METRSRKRAQAFEQAQSSPAREKKKPNRSSASSTAAARIREHRYPTRRSSQGRHQTSNSHQDSLPRRTMRSKKKHSADNLIEDTAQHETDSSQMEENVHKPSEKGKEKEVLPESKDKGKAKEFVSEKDTEYPHNTQATIKVEKARYVYLGGSYNMNVIMNILSNLKSGNDLMQIDSLTQLCEVLCMGNENTLSSVPVNSFVTELVKILNNDNPELMLLAARALTQLCEMIPISCNALVNQGAVPYFCGILQSIQYIDVAEQSLQGLFKISREHPGPCLRAGGLTAVLSNFDFYSTGVQRVAVSTAANMCKRMPPDAFNYVSDALPILTNLLEYPDSKVVEHVSVCLIRIAESFATSWEKLDILCMHGLIPAALRLLSVDHTVGDIAPQASLSSSTYTGLVRLLSICASGSSVAAESLLEMKISSIVKEILTTSGQSVSSVVMNMPSQQLCEIVTLINSLLPPTPQSLVLANFLQSQARVVNSNTASRKQPLCDQPSLLAQFGTDLFPVLVQVYGACLNAVVRSTCLDAIRKLVYFSSADILRPIFHELNISSFLVGLLASKDPTPQIAALQIADLLMQKLEDHFQKVFIKEGVLHTVSTQFGLELANSSIPGDRSKRRSKVSNVATESDDVKEERVIQSGVTPSEAPKKDLISMANTLAKKFKEMYFRSSSGTSETAIFKKLKKLCSTLSGEPKVKGKNGSMLPANDEAMTAALVEILTELGKDSSVSTFEFVGCGIVDSLLDYFSCESQRNEKLPPVELRQKVLERLQQFFTIATSCNNKSTERLLTLIVRKLQSALASLESFPVKLTRQPAGNNNSGHTVGLNALAHPIKLKFCRSSGEIFLRDFPSNIILVSPLTTLSSVEHYLWPHVRNPDAHILAASPSTSAPVYADSRSLPQSKLDAPVASERLTQFGDLADIDATAAIKIKGKQKIDNMNDRKGPETRSIAERRRQAAAASVHFEASPEVEDGGAEFYGSEDDEIFTTDDEYYSEDDRDDHGQVRLVSEEESIVCDVYEVLLEDERQPDGKLSKGVIGSTSTSSRGVVEDGLEGCVVVPGASSLSAPAKLCFSLGGRACDRSWTVLKAIQSRLASNGLDDERFTSLCYDRWFLDKLHTFDYQQAHSEMNSQDSPDIFSSLRHGKKLEITNAADSVGHTAFFLDRILQKKLPCDLDETSPTYNILLLLYILEGLNRLSPRFPGINEQERAVLDHPVSNEEFVSNKLMPKMIRQMQDALALCSGNLPAWCHQLIQACPFLFSFESRRQYFYLTSFGLPRALHRLQQQQIANNMASSNDRETRVNRLRRRKVRISRDSIFESAMKVMDLFSKDKGVLEVEYFDEVGTGLGPTLEFFTLLSHELQKASLGMWRSSAISDRLDDAFAQDDQNKNDLAYTPFGLFPRPWQQSSQNHGAILKHFQLLGQVVGKALQDGRLLDLPLSNLFYKLILEQDLDLYDIKFIDFELGNSLEQMHKLIVKKQQSKASKRLTKESKRGLRLHNTKVEELFLNFTLPGYPHYILKRGGDNIMVDSENLEEYITLVVDASVRTGILPQLDAFRAGFNQVFPISTLQIFNEEELSYMLCGHCDLWQPETLVEHLRFDHGYNASSLPVKYLLEIMGEFSAEQQRAFLQFVTGAPQLPCGGLAALRPKLTIVRKLPSGASGDVSPGSYATFVDGDLPSVMTCANYLKLPPYSCKEVMLERLLYAIQEGQGSFDLS
ncbi:hypothetical protein GOP47_0029817 [Adiantum capillus-veneris]|nr:hypothetical protein GOP47_0029817 [Adiantum capillus-veneris]